MNRFEAVFEELAKATQHMQAVSLNKGDDH